MRILSLNINDFGGSEFFLEKIKITYRWSWKEKWNEIQSRFNYDGLIDYLSKIDADILIFQEYDLNSEFAIHFTQKLNYLSYHLIKEETSIKRPSMTVMFSKIEYPLESTPHYKTEKSARSVQIKTSEVLLIGTHIPYDNLFWDELIEYYERKSVENSIIIIGDFNVCLEKDGNDLSKFQSLLLLGAIDLGEHLNKPTRNGKRIDFALSGFDISKRLSFETTPCKIKSKEFESIVIRNFSDHEAIILDID